MATRLLTDFDHGVRYYEANGPDPGATSTVVLVHGMGSSLDFWVAVIPQLHGARQVLAFDTPGFGLSQPPKRGFTLRDVANASESFFERRQVSQATVVGHSLGALLAIQIAANRPDLVTKLVLVDPVLMTVESILTTPLGIIRNPKTAFALAVQFAGVLMPPALATRILSTPILSSLAKPWIFSNPAAVDRKILTEALRYTGPSAASNVVRIIPAASKVRLVELMHQVTIPVEIVRGRDDQLCPDSDLRWCRRLLNVVTITDIEGSSHFPMIERPMALARVLNQAIRRPIPD